MAAVNWIERTTKEGYLHLCASVYRQKRKTSGCNAGVITRALPTDNAPYAPENQDSKPRGARGAHLKNVPRGTLSLRSENFLQLPHIPQDSPQFRLAAKYKPGLA